MTTQDIMNNPEILKAALVGYQIRRDEIDAKIAEVGRLLKGEPAHPLQIDEVWDAARKAISVSTVEVTAAPKPKRRLSAAGRKAISDATKKRWRMRRRLAAMAGK